MNRFRTIQCQTINTNDMNILEKADKYADGKANEAITKAIAQAYLDGYRDGYNDREAEIPVDFRNNKTTYVDLGLPSRTLWSTDYEKNGDDLVFVPYERAEYMKLPTIEQWKELYTCCKWEYKVDSAGDFNWAKCVGPNGNTLKFNRTGKKNIDQLSEEWHAFFWLEEDETTKAVHMFQQKGYSVVTNKFEQMFSGYHLPVRLVR